MAVPPCMSLRKHVMDALINTQSDRHDWFLLQLDKINPFHGYKWPLLKSLVGCRWCGGIPSENTAILTMAMMEMEMLMMQAMLTIEVMLLAKLWILPYTTTGHTIMGYESIIRWCAFEYPSTHPFIEVNHYLNLFLRLYYLRSERCQIIYSLIQTIVEHIIGMSVHSFDRGRSLFHTLF